MPTTLTLANGSPLTDGLLILRQRSDTDQYYLQLFDVDIIATAPSGLSLVEAKGWALDVVSQIATIPDGYGSESLMWSLSDGRLCSGGGAYHNGAAWVITDNGNITHANADIPASDETAGDAWIRSIARSQVEAAHRRGQTYS